MSLKRIPLPSIALVLTSNCVILPTRPSVIKFDFDPLQTIYPTSSAPGRVSNLNDTYICQRHPVALAAVDEDLFSNVLDDSATDIAGNDEPDAQTIVMAKTTTTSHDLLAKETTKFNFLILANAIRGLLRSRRKICASRIGRDVTRANIRE